MTKPSETLAKAVLLIEEHGWWQDNMRGPGGELCADGALWFAALVPGGTYHDYPVYDAARVMARRLLQMRGLGMGLCGYNDSPGRTKDEVLDLLRWMAEQAAGEGK